MKARVFEKPAMIKIIKLSIYWSNSWAVIEMVVIISNLRSNKKASAIKILLVKLCNPSPFKIINPDSSKSWEFLLNVFFFLYHKSYGNDK